ncbi:MAG: hypothetical protein Q4F84_02375 [Fibrobacter sp.]|nr:hypothetical protein [Fibrobacter sp.]
MRKRTIPFFGLICFTLMSVVYGQSAYYGFAEEPLDPRTIAMGSAGTALGSGGFTFYNPASISLCSEPYVTADFGKLADDLKRGFIETGWIFPKWFFGLSFQSQSIEFQYASEKGITEGAFGSEQATLGSFTIGLKRDRFAIAIAANGIQHRIAEKTSYGITASGGVTFEVIPGNLNAGAALTHIAGRNTRYLEEDNSLFSDDLPQGIRGGLAWHDTLKSIPYTGAIDISYSKNYERVMVPVGLEAWVLPMISLRLGKRFNHPTEILNAGIGFKWENLNFDAAFVPCSMEGDNGIKWTMGFSYRLPKFKPKKSAAKEPVSKDSAATKEESLETIIENMNNKVESEKDENVQDTVNIEQNESNTISDSSAAEVDQPKEGAVSEGDADSETEKNEPENSSGSNLNNDQTESTVTESQTENAVIGNTETDSSKESSDTNNTIQNKKADTDQVDEENREN